MNIDEIINANMTVTDPLLRDAIRSVCVDAIHAATAHEREECAKVCEETTASWSQPDYNSGCVDCAKAIRARGKR